MRTIEYLAQLFPDKTGRELLELQAQDKAEDKRKEEELHKDNLVIVDYINTNGLYFKGTFGLNQYFYYYIHKATLDNVNGQIHIEYDNITLFTEDEKNYSNFNMKKEKNSYSTYDKMGVSLYEKTDKADWDNINNFINTIHTNFWKPIEK